MGIENTVEISSWLEINTLNVIELVSIFGFMAVLGYVSKEGKKIVKDLQS